MTASRLGVTVGVSESTVVRFATELGYDGYPHLQRALQEMIRNKLTSVQRMEVAGDRMGGRDVLQTVLHADTDMIRVTLDETAMPFRARWTRSWAPSGSISSVCAPRAL